MLLPKSCQKNSTNIKNGSLVAALTLLFLAEDKMGTNILIIFGKSIDIIPNM